ncbi:MAG: TraG family conjugative transposon ATPase [Flavobacteriales bacterium]|jgi:conjugation system TraG family ATPase
MSKKKKNVFQLPYIGIETDKYPVLYHEEGHYSVVMGINNTVLRYSGDEDMFYEFHSEFTNIIKLLGAGYHVQKLDIFSTKKLNYNIDGKDYLSSAYFNSFNGRNFKDITTILVITKITKRSNFITYNPKEWKLFNINIEKVIGLLNEGGFNPKIYNEQQIDNLVKRSIAFDFMNDTFSIGNLKVEDEHINLGDRIFRSTSIIDVDEIQLPSQISPNTTIKSNGSDFPTDLFSFLYDIDSELLIYNQVIEVKDQIKERRIIEQKRDRHSSMPDPSNELAVKDIEGVLDDLAKSNQLLVNCHFSVSLVDTPEKVNTAYNDFEGKLFQLGIVPSKRTYNQLEVFASILPGNTPTLQEYDYFKTTIDPALCFFYKENLRNSDESDFKIFFSDREGIPTGVDISDLPMQTNRINNRNKFILGPSGSGKSFFMNHVVRQYLLQDTDIVLVDVGHSYSGLCEYYNGTYITYTQEKPITMNPFFISKEEFNIEKKANLKTLIGLLWKGAEGTLTKVEDNVISETINEYMNTFFLEGRQSELGFNSFYTFSLEFIAKEIQENELDFNLKEFKYILKDFYKGGEYETLLNANLDDSLFNENLIVFEIDSIKDNKILFPIVTMIIMDIFLQKMRGRKKRKCLIIEEAWKAIASPMMADYILYLYKTVRKFFGEAMLVTQELDDILKSEILKNSVLNNSDTVILLDQSKFKDNYDEVAKLLGLNEVEKNKIFTINKLDNKENRGRFKEVYISLGGTGEVWGVEVSTREYLVFTTEFSEKEALGIYTKKFNSFEKGLDAFVKDLESSNLSLPKFVSNVLAS